jgi:hypothetical protein
MSMRGTVGLVVAAALVAACGSSRPAAPSPSVPVTIRPIHVDSVEVLLGSAPAVHVKGVVGDGCTEISGTQVDRGEATVTITIYSQRPTEAICTQIARLYDEVLALPGAYPPGAYVVRVNGVEATFTIP